MNKIEELKAQKDGLDVGADIPRYAALGLEAIEEGDLDRLKWWGIFFRKQTPGYFMMRLRIPNGVTTTAQLRAIGGIANRVGRGLVDITTRQQVQLRWIRIQDVPEILDRLLDVGLVTLQTGMDNIRNIIGCPAFGLTPNEVLDASPVARAFTAMFVGSKAYTNLPRKFNVGITGCRENCTHSETQDIALVPAVKTFGLEEVKGFNVLVGGKNGSGGYRVASPLDVFVRPEEAAEVCSAIVLVFRDHGSRDARNKIRLSFLIDAWGEAQFREAVEARVGRRLDKAGADQRLAQSTDHVGVFRQKQPGLNYVGLLVPVGRVTGAQLVELARLCEQYGTGEARLTVDQNVIIPNVPDPILGRLTAEPLLKTLRYDPSGVMRGLVSCTGVEFCNLGGDRDQEPRPADRARARAEGARHQGGSHPLVRLSRRLRQPHGGRHRAPRHPHEGGRQGGRRGRHLHGRRLRPAGQPGREGAGERALRRAAARAGRARPLRRVRSRAPPDPHAAARGARRAAARAAGPRAGLHDPP